MIKYQLSCKNCKNVFNSWFASSKEYEKLKKMNLINCNSCHSLNIDKSIMSPRISTNLDTKNPKNQARINEVKSKIQEFQSYIKKNFKYVGKNFSYEARSIHYNQKKSKKGIYGKASIEEVNELKDEGIETEMIPWIEEKEN